MTNPQALREALEQIKANCFRSDITDHTALAGIAIIAKEALASTTVATAATDARAIVEACAKVAESEAPMSLFRSETCSEDMAAEYCFQAEYASWLAIELRAKADEIIAALPLPTPSAPDAALREAVTILIEKRIPHGMDQWVRDLAWEVFALSNSGQMEMGA